MSAEIAISKDHWDEIRKAAIEASKDNIVIKAFFLYVTRGKPLEVVDAKQVPTKLIKANSNCGPIFRWDYPKEQRLVYYPPKNGIVRYGGTALINEFLLQQPLGLSLHYAYWMGVDFGLSAGINISLWQNKLGQIDYKACYVNAAKTNGEFVECTVHPH